MQEININNLYELYNINFQTQYTTKEINDFYVKNKDILNLTWKKLEVELITKWTHNKYIKLLIILNNLSINGILISIWSLNNNSTNEIDIIKKTIFEKNNFEKLYNKFIVPKSIMDNEVNYGYTEKEKKYIANLTTPNSEIESKINFLDINFAFNKDTSLEWRRRNKKKWLELIITSILKSSLIKNNISLKEWLFKYLDDQLAKEKQNKIDTELWSLHNVIYWFISWKNIYKTRWIQFSENSHYIFLELVFNTMKILKDNLN